MSWGFEVGKVYNRKIDIHGRFGGQPRPGIVTPSAHAVIFLISGDTGLQHGYDDKKNEDGSVDYFGMGRVGDMKMKSGNRAILNHSAEGKSLLVFRRERGRRLTFWGEMICDGYDVRRAKDTNGKDRDAIVFKLVPLTAVIDRLDDDTTVPGDELEQLRAKALEASNPTPEQRKTTASVFKRSRDVKNYILARAKGKCEECLDQAPFTTPKGVPYLEPHHIHRLSDGGPDDPRTIIALCPNCHKRAHFGQQTKVFNQALLAKVKHIEAT